MSHPRRCATAIFLTALFVSGLVNAQPAGGAKMLAPVEFHALDERPIDLATALRLANVDNPEIRLARERVREAVAQRQLAAAQFLPNLNAGTNLDHHLGLLQQSNGNLLRVNHDSLYVGLGAGAVGAGT